MCQGRKSTQDERGVAALKAIEVDDSLNGAAKQVGHISNMQISDLPCQLIN